MASNSTIDFSKMPNPLAPEAWLSPEEADKHRTYIYVLVSGLCVVLWDMLSCFPEDFTITFRRRWSLYTVPFLISRFFTLGFLLAGTISSTREVENCQTANLVDCAFNLVTLTSINVLLYFKACEVYKNQRCVVAGLGVACVGMLTGPILDFFALLGRHIEPTLYCQLVVQKPSLVVTPILQGVFGLAICFAIVHKLALPSPGDSSHHSIKWRSAFCDIRETATSIRERYFKDEQLYLIIAALAKIPTIVAFCVFRGSNTATQITFTILDLSVVSIMIAKVYRKPLLGTPAPPKNVAPVTTIDNLDFLKGSTGSTSMSTQEAKILQDIQRDVGEDIKTKPEMV
ncbi:hypothetical protein CPB83DRAFT_851158 [Crepidotus variabilis]|uniref:Uncharacterized protein n=1 Tax=Crepidotus variabilis TaxID=179855 RepID=A0A9P6EIB6_9AGAR|nr:hypothetical protein CPB83DRAFT_851158 [Crepidotus variabilis]